MILIKILIFGLFGHLAAQAEGSCEIRFLSTVEVSSSQVNLTDIVHPNSRKNISGLDHSFVQLDKKNQERLSRAEVSSRLRALPAIEKLRRMDCSLVIPDHVSIRRMSTAYNREAIEAQIRESWQRACSNCEFEFIELQIPKIDIERSDVWSLDVPNRLPALGTFQLPLRLQRLSRSELYWVSGRVRIGKPIPVATKRLDQNATLSSEDYIFELRDITHFRQRTPEKQDLVDVMLTRSILAGEPLLSDHIRRTPAIRRGQYVSVRSVVGGIEVQMRGEAESDAWLGDRIRVKNRESSQTVSALVTGQGEARVE